MEAMAALLAWSVLFQGRDYAQNVSVGSRDVGGRLAGNAVDVGKGGAAVDLLSVNPEWYGDSVRHCCDERRWGQEQVATVPLMKGSPNGSPWCTGPKTSGRMTRGGAP